MLPSLAAGAANTSTIGDQVASGLSALPMSAHVSVGVLFLVGLVLWLTGQRVVRVGFVLLGGGVLGLGAYALGPALGLGLHPLILGVVGLLAGALMGLALFKFTVGSLCGLVGSILFPMIVVGALRIGVIPEGELELPQQRGALGLEQMQIPGVPLVEGATATPAERGEGGDLPEMPSLPEGLEELLPGESLDGLQRINDAITQNGENLSPSRFAGAIRGDDDPDGPGGISPDDPRLEPARKVARFLTQVAQELRPHWDGLNLRDRVLLIGAGVLGSTLGFLLGMTFAKTATAFLTAGIGAAIWLPGAVYLAHAGSPELAGKLALPTLVWVAAWAVLSLVGGGLQWMTRPKSSDSKA
ncbi:MAG: hypothetical protein AAGD00_03080 [Planctomycetota bacterium]